MPPLCLMKNLLMQSLSLLMQGMYLLMQSLF